MTTNRSLELPEFNCQSETETLRPQDAATYDTIQVLRQHGLTPENILGTSVDTLTDLLAKAPKQN